MRAPLVAMLALLLSGCLDGGDAPPSHSSEPADSTVWALHGNGTHDLWMDAQQEGNNISLWGVVTPNQDPTWWTFPLRPAPDGLPVTDARFRLRLDVEDVQGEPPIIETRLVVDGREVARGSGQGGDLLVPAGTVADASLAFAVCVCRDQGSISYRYDLALGGSSTLTLQPADAPPAPL